MLTSAFFSKKEEKDTSLKISLEFAFIGTEKQTHL